MIQEEAELVPPPPPIGEDGNGPVDPYAVPAPPGDDEGRDRGRKRSRSRSRDRRGGGDTGRRSEAKRGDSRDREQRSRSRDRGGERRGGGRGGDGDTTPPRRRPRPPTGWDVFPNQLPGGQAEGIKTIPNPNAPLHIQQQQMLASTPAASQKTRHARRVYCGNLPEGAQEADVKEFFCGALLAVGGVTNPGDPVLSIYMNKEKHFGFIEFRDIEECSNATALDGIVWKGNTLRVKRPNDYNSTEAAPLGPSLPNPLLNLEAIGLSSDKLKPSAPSAPEPTMAPAPAAKPVDEDADNKIFIGGIPQFFTEDQMTAILRPFGEVKKFSLVRDKATGKSKGYGFAVYFDKAVTDVVCSALNGFKLQDRTLTVKRAIVGGGREGDDGRHQSAQRQQQQAVELLQELQRREQEMIGQPSRFVCLMDALTPEEVGDDEEYRDIFEDMRDMFTKFGLVARIVIPRPGSNGCGCVFVEYDNVSQAVTAREGVHGKPFGGKPVVAVFKTEQEFHKYISLLLKRQGTLPRLSRIALRPRAEGPGSSYNSFSTGFSFPAPGRPASIPMPGLIGQPPAQVPIGIPDADGLSGQSRGFVLEQLEGGVTLTSGNARLNIRSTGEFKLWRRQGSLNGLGNAGRIWGVVSKGKVTIPHGSDKFFSVHREGEGQCEVRWGLFVRLSVIPASRSTAPWASGLESGFVMELRVKRMVGMAEITLDLNEAGAWFGGSHMMNQIWPLNQASLECGPYYPFDNGPTGLNTLVGHHWVTSTGLMCCVDPDSEFFHVGMNAPVRTPDEGWVERFWGVGVQNMSREYLPLHADNLRGYTRADGVLRLQSRRSFLDPWVKHPLDTWVPNLVPTILDRLNESVKEVAKQLDNLMHGHGGPLESGFPITALSSLMGDATGSLVGLIEKEDDPTAGWLKMSIAICAAHNVKEATLMGLKTLPPPRHIPDPSVFRDPIWTTWARYHVKVDRAKTLKYAEEIVSRGLGRSVMEIDDRWQTKYGDLTFDQKKFPDAKGMCDQLHAMGFKVTVWVHPFFEEGSEGWKEGHEKGYFVQGDGGGWGIKPGFFRWWNPPPVQALDVTNTEAVKWFVDRLHKCQAEYGIDGFKFDAGEPCFLPKNARTHRPLRHPSEYTRLYVERVAGRFQGGLSEVRSGAHTTSVAVLTRMGDRFSTWGVSNGLQSIIPTLLTSSVLGYPFALPDMVGGNAYFGSKPSSELMIRWAQASALMPAVQFSIPPWDLGREAEEACAKVMALRARLSKRIVALAEEAAQTLQPIARPMWWLAPYDPSSYSIMDQFTVGDDIVVAPVVVQGARARDIYLPPGLWADISGGATAAHCQVYEGGRWVRGFAAPLDLLPVFQRVPEEDDLEGGAEAHVPGLSSIEWDGSIVGTAGDSTGAPGHPTSTYSGLGGNMSSQYSGN